MRPTGGQVVRSMRRGGSARGQKVVRGTTRRILRFAAPYRRLLLFFLFLVTIDAVIGVVNPLFYRQIINKGIGGHDTSLVVTLALVIAGLALVDASLSLGRAVRVGAGGRRSRVRHADQDLLPHPAHAAGLLHPHTDGGACQPLEQRRPRRTRGVHRRAFHRRRQPDKREPGPCRHVPALVAAHPRGPCPPPRVRDPGPMDRAPAPKRDARAIRPERRHEHHHGGAVQCLRSAAGEAVRPPRRRRPGLPRQGRPRARYRRDPSHLRQDILRLPPPHRLAGDRPGVWLGRRPSRPPSARRGDARGPHRLSGPPVRSADRPFEHPGGRHHHPRLLRARLRGAGHETHGHREAGRRRHSARAGLGGVRPRDLRLSGRRGRDVAVARNSGQWSRR